MLAIVPAAPPIRCTAADMLDKARFALDRQFFAEAGALLREALRQSLLALMEYHAVELPRRKVRRTTGELAILLERAGKLPTADANWALELLDVGNRAAHCAFVTRKELSTAINMAGWFVSERPAAVGGDA